MADALHKDMYRHLAEMKQIITGEPSKQPKEKMKKSQDDGGQMFSNCIVQNDGLVNQQARSELLAHVIAMTEIMDNQQKKGQKQSMSSFIGGFFQGSKKIQIFLSPKIRTFSNFGQALTMFCKQLLNKFEIVEDITKLQDTHPLFVVCPVSTRLEPDIDHILKGMDWKRKFAVLVVHYGAEDTLPRLPTSTVLYGIEKYKLIEFVDLAFTEESRFYTCEMNTSGQRQLLEFAEKAMK